MSFFTGIFGKNPPSREIDDPPASGGGGAQIFIGGILGLSGITPVGTMMYNDIVDSQGFNSIYGTGPFEVAGVLNLPAANLDTSDKILGTAALKLNDPSNSNERLIRDYNALFDFSKADPFSFAMWAKGYGSWDNYNYLVNHSYSSGNYNGIVFRAGDGSSTKGKPYFRLRVSGSDYITVMADTALTIDTWYHLAATYDGSNTVGGMKIYVNGNASTPTTEGGNGSGTLTGDITNPNALAIGGRSAATTWAWEGRIDDAAVWDVKLSDANVASLYNSGTGALANTVLPGNLVAYYPFDTSTTSADISGNDFHMEFFT